MEISMKRMLIATVALFVGFGTATAGNTDHPNFDKKGNPPGFSEGNKTGWDNGNEPPGWDKGEKQGWNNEDSPPGLQKKSDHHDYDKKDK